MKNVARISLMFLLTANLTSHAQTTVINYDESADGDLSCAAEPFFILGEGSNTFVGTEGGLSGGPIDFDCVNFTIPPGHQLDAVTFRFTSIVDSTDSQSVLGRDNWLQTKDYVVLSGATFSAIDPTRYLLNAFDGFDPYSLFVAVLPLGEGNYRYQNGGLFVPGLYTYEIQLSVSANAGVKRWEVDVELTNGGVITGTYGFDASTGIFSDVMVSATGGAFPATSASLTDVIFDWSNGIWIDLIPSVNDLTGIEDVFLVLESPMTDLGGVINVTQIERYLCTNADCTTFDFLSVNSSFVGEATVTSIPKPSELLEELGTAVTDEGPGSSFADKISLAQAYLDVPDEESACLMMNAFLNQVRAQRGKKLTEEQADQFTSDAEAIIAAIGCD